MRHARGQLPYRLDALRPAQLGFGLFALVDLRGEPPVGGFEFGGALGDALLEPFVGAANVVDVDRSAEPEHQLRVEPHRPIMDAVPAMDAIMAANAGLDAVFAAAA